MIDFDPLTTEEPASFYEILRLYYNLKIMIKYILLLELANV